MHRHFSSLLAFSVLSLAGYAQSASLACTTGPAAASAIRQLPDGGDTQQHPQNRTSTAKKMISGMVKEQGSGPLEGVLVTTKDGSIVSGSMQDGQYYIEIPADDSVLVFSLDGYATREIKLLDGGDYSVTLKPADPNGSQAPASAALPANRPSTAPFSALGPWRGVFQLNPGVEVPFNFEVRSNNKGRPEAFFRNGAEWFDGGPLTQTPDSFFIALDQYDNELAFPIGQGSLIGSLRRQDRKGNPLTVRIEPGYDAFTFALPDIDGKTVTLQDPRFKNKIVIVTIGGTWCPNCVDETSFLAPWYKENRERGIEVVSIQYERSTVAASLPSLNTFLAFPTTIVIDRRGRVARIHTGYSGPATGPYYQEFLKEFNAEIDALVKE